MKGYEVRRNPKTGKKEIRKRYRYRDQHGDIHGSKTPWLRSKTDVDEYIKDIQTAKAQGALTDDPTIEQCLTAWIDWLQSDDNSGMHPGTTHTYLGYARLQKKTLPKHLLSMHIHRFDEDAVIEWAGFYFSKYRPKRCNGKAISNNSYSQHKKTLTMFLDWLYAETDWATGNPALLTKCKTDIEMIKRTGYHKEKKKTESAWWTYENFLSAMDTIDYIPVQYEIPGEKEPEGKQEFQQHLKYLAKFTPTWKDHVKRRDITMYSVIATMYYSGMRPEEIRALRWGKVDFDTRRVHVNTAVNYRSEGSEKALKEYREKGQTKNESSKRYIPIITPLYNVLFSWYEYNDEPDEDKLVFPPPRKSKDGMLAPTTIQGWLNDLSDRASIPEIHDHSLRHSCATYYAWERHFPKKLTADLLGHTDESMLDEVYLHMKEDIKIRGIEEELNKNKSPD